MMSHAADVTTVPRKTGLSVQFEQEYVQGADFDYDAEVQRRLFGYSKMNFEKIVQSEDSQAFL